MMPAAQPVVKRWLSFCQLMKKPEFVRAESTPQSRISAIYISLLPCRYLFWGGGGQGKKQPGFPKLSG